jgi:hypothetical protein
VKEIAVIRLGRSVQVEWGYALSLPERTLRALAVGLGGLLYEAALVLLPEWLRATRLYRAIVAGTLRLAVELVGGASGLLPPDEVTAQELAVRKAAGAGLDLAGLMLVGLSPVWLFAAAADVTGGTRTYLRALAAELRAAGLLPADADIASVAELLDYLEGTSGHVAESFDTPPLNVADMRASWQSLKEQATDLPDAHRLGRLHANLRRVASEDGRSLRSVSSLLAAGAARAGIKTGQLYIFDYYEVALRTVAREGLATYSRRVTNPYLAVAREHFDPRRPTHTERLLQCLRRHRPEET